NIVNIQPRQSVALDVVTADVAVSYWKLKSELGQIAKSQIRGDQLNEQDKLRTTASLEFNVPADKKKEVDKLIASLGPELIKKSVQAALTDVATDQKFGYTLRLFTPASIAPREMVTLRVEVKDVEGRVAAIKEAVRKQNGRIADEKHGSRATGLVSAT